MSYANGTEHYNLPQTVGTDKRDWFDTNSAFAAIDAALYAAATGQAADAEAISTINGQIVDIQGNITTLQGTVGGHTTQIGALQASVSGLSNTVADVRQDAEDMISAYNEGAAEISTHAYSIGDYFIYNDVLYKATAAIAIGDTIVPNTNCQATNVTTEIKAVEASIPADKVGDLADLTTSDKTSVVAAIDEVNSKLAKGEVSVIADGVKTYTQLLNELYALVDKTKLDGKSYFVGLFGLRATITSIQTSYIGFNITDVSQTALTSSTFGLKATDSYVYSFNGTTVTDVSSNVVTNGSVLKVVY